METKIINPLRTGFKITSKIKVKNCNCRLIQLIMGPSSVAPTCLYALPTTSRHAPDVMTDGVLGDLLPNLDQGISEHNVPEVLNWIQFWETWGPVNGINAFVIQELLIHSGQALSCTRRNPWPTEDLILVPNSSQACTWRFVWRSTDPSSKR